MHSRSYAIAICALIFTVLALQLTGCDRASSVTATSETVGLTAGSCNNGPSGFCNEFTGSSYKAASVQRSCEGQKMEFLAGACPAPGRVGSCLVYKGKASESHYRYYAGFPGYGAKPAGGPAAAAKSQCMDSLKGEWTPN